MSSQPAASGDDAPDALDVSDANALAQALSSYRRPNHVRGVLEVIITVGPLLAIWLLACLALHARVWWGLVLVIPAAGFLVRLFMIQHDCGHGAFFRDRLANDWLGRAIGVFTLTPYDYWRHTHAVHHATSGDLDHRTLGGVETLTVTEYQSLSPLRRLGYRLYRHPLVMFGLGPAYLFIIQQRLPVGMMGGGWRPWLSTMATNLAIGIFALGTLWVVGPRAVLLINLPITLLAGSIGVWLFYVQHQFADTFWARRNAWTMRHAALRGSSHYDLPPVLRWFTANIGLHHVHHLSSRIPFYRLHDVLRDHPRLGAIGRLTLLDSLGCINLSLWDEPNQQLVSFGHVRRSLVHAAPSA